MMGRTHVLLGLNTLWLVEPLALGESGLLVPLATGAIVGALLPDLDIPGSLLSRASLGGVQPLMLPARWINERYGHRGALHSLRGWGVATLMALPLVLIGLKDGLGLALWWGLVMGYGSHLLGDACTRSGIPLWYPDPHREHLLPKSLRLLTGSFAEDVVLVLLALALFGLLLLHLPFGLGFYPSAGWG